MNIVNTLSSIAQHYGVALDVIRADPDAEALLKEQKRGISERDNELIKKNLKDSTMLCMNTSE